MSYISGLGRALPTSSMASPTSQAARPRTTSARANAYIQQVYAAKGKQKQLEVLLAKLKQQLSACRVAVKSGKVPASACVSIEQAIAACIREIQRCVSVAKQAVQAAVSSGATTTQVKVASAAGTASGSTGITYEGARINPAWLPAPSSTPVVESTTASLLPNGQIVPGPGAQVIDTPSLSETMPQPSADGETTLQPQDVAVSVGTGSIGTVVLIGVAGLIGWSIAKKKGWL